MNFSRLTRRAARWFRENKNIISAAKREFGDAFSQKNIIEVSYDLQAGTYIRDLRSPGEYELKQKWGARLGAILREHNVQTACEAGIGEATTLAFVQTSAPEIPFSGFDLSMSRLLCARDFLTDRKSRVELFCADMEKIPLPNSSIDAVLTNHSLEPNGGNEGPLLRELLRTASRYLMLIEPDFENAAPEQKERMKLHNYACGLRGRLAEMPGEIVRDEPWPYWHNELNKASLIIFEKESSTAQTKPPEYVSPVNKLSLKKLDDFLFCEEEGLLYPDAFGIPVLKEETAILCFHAKKAIE